MNWVITGGTNFYVRTVRRALKIELVMLLLFAGGLWATWSVYKAVPSSFVPEEDEGYFIAIIQAPSGASLEYTTNIAKQAEQIIMAQPEVLAVFSVAGFSFSGSAPNQGLIFARLKPFEERRKKEQSLSELLNRLRGPIMFGIKGAFVIPVAPPAIQGLQVFGGFSFEVLDSSGGDISNLANVTYQMMGRGQRAG